MEKASFETLARTIRPRLVARARTVVHDPMTADDLAQDALLKLWTMRSTLDGYESVEALAMVMVYRMSLNHLRSAGALSSLSEAAGVTSSDPQPDEAMMHDEVCVRIGAILAMLPAGQAAILRMKHVEGMETAEIAALIDSTEGAVRTALSRARQRIARIFAENNIQS